MEKALFTCVVGKNEHILTKNINTVLKAISSLENQKQYDPFRALSIAVDGYNDSAEELWENKDVRAWFQKLINRVPHLLYFIENDLGQTEQTVMLCLNDFIYAHETNRKPISAFESLEELPRYAIKIEVHRKSYKEMCSALRKYGKKQHDTHRVEELIKEMDDRYDIE